jgi:hypothetical protein
MRFFRTSHDLETQLSITEDTAKRLDFWHPTRVVHFHLKTYFTPKNKIRQDLSEEAFNQTDLTVPPIFWYHPLQVPMAEPLILLNQDRAHSVIRLH